MHIGSIADILDCVKMAGAIALEELSQTVSGDRSYKRDGSVLTEADRRVEDYLFGEISRLYPSANIITEETVRFFDPTKPYTFAIDPIDGTDVFSQGMAGWCVSVGLLDKNFNPIAGIVFSPRLDFLVFADIGKKATYNGNEIVTQSIIGLLSVKSNVMISFRLHRQIDLTKYPGKVRSIGSAALHLCFPLVHSAVVGAIQHSGVHIWDITAAHAINLSHGWNLEYLSEGAIDYSDLIDGSPATDIILSGPDRIVDSLMQKTNTSITKALRPRDQNNGKL